jgi:hypothetical protein
MSKISGTENPAIQAQLQSIMNRLDSLNINIETIQTTLSASEKQSQELIKMVGDMTTKQDIAMSSTPINTNITTHSNSKVSTTSVVKAKQEITGIYADVKLGNKREFFKSLFINHRNVVMVRDDDNEFKLTMGITKNGVITNEMIENAIVEEKKTLDSRKTQALKDKALSNIIYKKISNESRDIIKVMMDQLDAFIKKQKFKNLEVDNVKVEEDLENKTTINEQFIEEDEDEDEEEEEELDKV